MSTHNRLAFAGLFISLCIARPVSAMGGNHPATQPIGQLQSDWPASLPVSINSPGRVAGHWVNANDEFFYLGNTHAFNDFLTKLAETKLPLTLVIHSNSPHRSLLWGEEPRIPYDWTLLVAKSGWVSPEWNLNFENPADLYALRIDLWVTGKLEEKDFHLPASFRVRIEHARPSTSQPTAR